MPEIIEHGRYPYNYNNVKDCICRDYSIQRFSNPERIWEHFAYFDLEQ